MINKTNTCPCEGCIILAICRGLYNGLLYAYLKEMKDTTGRPSFKPGALAKARILLANKCSIIDKYLYSPGIDGVENLRREKIHHRYFVGNDPILQREYQR